MADAKLLLCPTADLPCQQAKGLSQKQEEAAKRLQWQVALLLHTCMHCCLHSMLQVMHCWQVLQIVHPILNLHVCTHLLGLLNQIVSLTFFARQQHCLKQAGKTWPHDVVQWPYTYAEQCKFLGNMHQ